MYSGPRVDSLQEKWFHARIAFNLGYLVCVFVFLLRTIKTLFAAKATISPSHRRSFGKSVNKIWMTIQTQLYIYLSERTFFQTSQTKHNRYYLRLILSVHVIRKRKKKSYYSIILLFQYSINYFFFIILIIDGTTLGKCKVKNRWYNY